MKCVACENERLACKGGNNKDCAKRDPLPSVIVGILDTYGGLRTVIEHRKAVYHHIRHDELAVVVPRIRLHEPIAWNDIPAITAIAKDAVDKWIKQYGIPNDPDMRECVVMYQLRQKENIAYRRSFDPSLIAYT